MPFQLLALWCDGVARLGTSLGPADAHPQISAPSITLKSALRLPCVQHPLVGNDFFTGAKRCRAAKAVHRRLREVLGLGVLPVFSGQVQGLEGQLCGPQQADA